MIDPNRQISDQIGVFQNLATVFNGATPVVTAYVSGKAPRKFLAIFSFGDVGDVGITCQINKASDTGGTGAALLKAATAIVHSAAANDSGVVLIDLDQAEMDAAKPFLALSVVADGAETGRVTMMLLGGFAREQALAAIDSALVLQIKK